MDARPPRIAQVTAKTDDMKTLVPMVDNDSDKSLNRDSSRQSTVSTAASTASSIADGSSARFATKEGVMQNTSLRVNNFLSNPPERGSDSQWADTKPPTRKVSMFSDRSSRAPKPIFSLKCLNCRKPNFLIQLYIKSNLINAGRAGCGIDPTFDLLFCVKIEVQCGKKR